MTHLLAASVRPGEVALVEARPEQDLRSGYARVTVTACGLCGSDRHLLDGMELPPGASYPVRPGHEVAGLVERVVPGLGVEIGDTVVLHPLATCGECASCGKGEDHLCTEGRMLGIHDPGGLAGWVDWPADRLVIYRRLPAHQAALLPDAVATAYHAWRTVQLPTGGTLAVLGAGGVGTHLLQIAAHLDPSARLVAVVRSQATADRLKALPGVEVVLTDLPEAGRAVRAACGTVDAAVDFTGTDGAAAQAVRMVGRGGRVVLGSIVDTKVDLEVSMAHLVTREISVSASYASTLADLRAVVELADTGALDLSGSVSHRLPLSEVDAAFRLLRDRPPGLLRVVVEP